MWREYPHTAPWQQSQQQQHSFVQPPMPLPPPGVVWPPAVANDRTNFKGIVIGLFVLAFFFAFLVVVTGLLTSPLLLASRLALLFIFLLPGISITMGIMANKQSQRWKVVNERRQKAAAYGFAPDVPLAEPQPVPNLGALPLHSTIKLKVNWLSTLTCACLTVCYPLLFLMCLVLCAELMAGATFQEIVLLFNSFPTYLLLIYICQACLYVWSFSRSQRIDITPEGVIVKHAFYDWASNNRSKKKSIRWEQARLFAIRSGKPGGPTVRYELSGPFAVVTFERILRPRWWSRFRPGQSFGEYNAQMDALLVLISAHTGLLLYDVRQHE